MNKIFIAAALVCSGLVSATQADDLFTRASSDAPYAGSKSNADGSRPALSDRGQKLLNADHLAEMLREGDLNPKVEGDDLVSLKFRQSKWDFPIAMNLSDHNSRLWIVLIVTKIESGHSLNAEQLTGLLAANRDLRPAAFAVGDHGKRVELYLALPNEQISPKVLLDNIHTLASVAEGTAGLWEAAATSAKSNTNSVANNNPPNNSGATNSSANNNPVPNSPPPTNSQANNNVKNNPPTNGATNSGSGSGENKPAHTFSIATILGKWSATLSENNALAIRLKDDNTFVMVQVKDGKQIRSSGSFTLVGRTLSLLPTDGEKTVGSIPRSGEKAFEFVPQSGPLGTNKLTFKRAT